MRIMKSGYCDMCGISTSELDCRLETGDRRSYASCCCTNRFMPPALPLTPFVNKLHVLKVFRKKIRVQKANGEPFWYVQILCYSFKISGHAWNRLLYDSEIELFILYVLFNNVIRIIAVELASKFLKHFKSWRNFGQNCSLVNTFLIPCCNDVDYSQV